ncbi:hypothetical protein ACS0TY_015963 [Phlomoides rotata]
METSSAATSEPPTTETRVMVAIDDSEESFYSLQWVLDNLFGSAVFPTTSIIQSVNKAQEENASAILTHALNMCTRKKVKAKTTILEGDPKEMICDLADQMHIDLIVICNRGLGKIKRYNHVQYIVLLLII